MLKKCKRGFTLLELLVVVLIIGILAGIALPQYEKTVEKARLSGALMNIKVMLDAVQRYNLKNNVDEDDVFFKDCTDVDLSGGEWNDSNEYITKDFEYTVLTCGTLFAPEIIRTNGYYVLLPEIRNGQISKYCFTNETDMGRYICKYLESQGWEYIDEEW